jgi:aryl-alcohol dehydrogenase-like predicted oxidoreductase
LSRYHILREVERSLKKLRTDRIDIYYMHKLDPDTEFEETLRAMEDLLRQGKVRYVGVSNFKGTQIVELLWLADRLGLEPIACLQNQYNLLHRWKIEADLFPLCRRFGLGLSTYSPLAVGLLSGQFKPGQPTSPAAYWSQSQLQNQLNERGQQVISTLLELAAARGVTPAQLAIAWLLDHPEVSAPIVGADRPDYVDDVFGALEIKLSEAERQKLDEISQWEEPGQYL